MEFQILDALQGLHTPVLDEVMVAITTLGNRGFIWVLIGIILLCSRQYRRCGLFMLLSLLGCLLVGNVFLKNLVERPRPSWINPNVPLLIPNPKDFSFPSGHSMASFAGAASLWQTKKAWGAAAFILAGLIAFSRLYLYVHFPTDVLFGIVAGVLISLAVFAAGRRKSR